MSPPLKARVLALLGEHHVMTLASVGADGPWAAAVFYAHDDLRLYFLSAPTSRHAVNLAAEPRAIMEALNRIRWYEFVPDDIHLIDNTLGFGHREHLSPSCGD